jgi:hypothetical protein
MKKSNKNKIVKKAILLKNNVLSEYEVEFKREGFVSLFNAQHIYLEMTSKQRCFFDFLCEKMNEQNKVLIDTDLRNEFIVFLDKITSGKISLTQRALINYIKILIELRLIILYGNSSFLYVVNPKYVYKGAEINRKRILDDLIKNHMKYNIDIQSLLDIPLSEIEFPIIPDPEFITLEDGSIEIID